MDTANRSIREGEHAVWPLWSYDLKTTTMIEEIVEYVVQKSRFQDSCLDT